MHALLASMSHPDISAQPNSFAWIAVGVSLLPMFCGLVFGRWKEFRHISLGRLVVLLLVATVFAAGTKVLAEHLDAQARVMFDDPEAVGFPWWAGVLLPVLGSVNVQVLYQFVRYEPELTWSRWRRLLDAIVAWGIALTLSTFCLGASMLLILMSHLILTPMVMK